MTPATLPALPSDPASLAGLLPPSPAANDGPARLVGRRGRRGLTAREVEVLRHLAAGLSNRDVAARLAISAETVKAHVQHLLHKLGVGNRTQAAVWAVRQQLI
jgi:DNA-binding NarL/FixJ family response regulator